MSKIYLVGLPGAGKSTLGRQLGNLLSLDFIDLDQEIVSHTGASIGEIFALQGEAGFRQIEHDVFRRLLQRKASFIMATGGGTPCFFDHMSQMNRSGLTVYLTAPPEVIAERVKRDQGRPLINSEDPIEVIMKLLENRSVHYNKAMLTIDTQTHTIEEIVMKIKKAA